MRVHAESRRGVHLDDAPTRFPDRLRDIGTNQIDACDIEPDHERSLPDDGGVVGMNVIGAIDGGTAGADIAGLLELHDGSIGRNRGERESFEFKQVLGLMVDRDTGERFFVSDTAAGIGIGDLDQFAHSVCAISDYPRRYSFRHRHNRAIDHQHPVIFSFEMPLNHNFPRPAFTHSQGKGIPDGIGRAEPGRYPASMIAIQRLNDDGKSDTRRCSQCIVERRDDVPLRRWQPDISQQAVGEPFVTGDINRRIRGG